MSDNREALYELAMNAEVGVDQLEAFIDTLEACDECGSIEMAPIRRQNLKNRRSSLYVRNLRCGECGNVQRPSRP